MYRSLAYVAVAALAVGCVEQQNDMPSEEDIKAAHEHVLAQPPANIQHPSGAQLEDKLEYLGMDVDTDTVTPGKARPVEAVTVPLTAPVDCASAGPAQASNARATRNWPIRLIKPRPFSAIIAFRHLKLRI